MSHDIWYALVAFGSPSFGATDRRLQSRRKDRREVGQGPRELTRLRALSAQLMGTGSCTCVRVVECASEADALDADISDQHRIAAQA